MDQDQNNWVLTLRGGHFGLITNIKTFEDPRAKMLIRDGWERFSAYDADKYKTKNPRLARRFSALSDEHAKVILQRFFIHDKKPHRAGGSFLKALMPHQLEGAKKILSQSKTYIAHDPGLGKTLTCIAAADYVGEGLVTIICPPSLKTVWEREIMQWSLVFPRTISVVGRKAGQEVDWTARWLIVPDTFIIKDWVMEGLAARKSKFFIVDEAHRFKEPRSKRSLALFGGETAYTKKKAFHSEGLIYENEHLVFLSGTPMPNRPMELWPVMFAAAPNEIDFMSRHDFGLKFCGDRVDPYTGYYLFRDATNMDELKARLTRKFMHRVRKSEVMKDLPDKVRQIIFTDQLPTKPETKAFEKRHLNTSEYELTESLSLGEFAKYRKEAGLAKVNWSARFITEALEESNESVLVFCHHKEVLNQLEQSLSQFRPQTIRGGDRDDDRTRAVDAFQNGDTRLLIGSIEAVQLGLTLTKATRVIFAEFSWVPEGNRQAEDRAHRKGQKDSVLCQYLTTPGTLDERILQTILRKQKAIDSVVG